MLALETAVIIHLATFQFCPYSLNIYLKFKNRKCILKKARKQITIQFRSKILKLFKNLWKIRNLPNSNSNFRNLLMCWYVFLMIAKPYSSDQRLTIYLKFASVSTCLAFKLANPSLTFSQLFYYQNHREKN